MQCSSQAQFCHPILCVDTTCRKARPRSKSIVVLPCIVACASPRLSIQYSTCTGLLQKLLLPSLYQFYSIFQLFYSKGFTKNKTKSPLVVAVCLLILLRRWVHRNTSPPLQVARQVSATAQCNVHGRTPLQQTGKSGQFP